MMDLISRDNLKESLIHCNGLGRKSFELVLLVIDEQPTIDAVPVVRGEVRTIVGKMGVMHQECSICGNGLEWKAYPNYCDECGAKLDGADMRKGGSNE